MITNSFFIPLKELGFAVMDSGAQRIKLAEYFQFHVMGNLSV